MWRTILRINNDYDDDDTLSYNSYCIWSGAGATFVNRKYSILRLAQCWSAQCFSPTSNPEYRATIVTTFLLSFQLNKDKPLILLFFFFLRCFSNFTASPIHLNRVVRKKHVETKINKKKIELYWWILDKQQICGANSFAFMCIWLCVRVCMALYVSRSTHGYLFNLRSEEECRNDKINRLQYNTICTAECVIVCEKKAKYIETVAYRI